MRLVADPEADAVAAEVFKEGGATAIARLRPLLDNWDQPLTADVPSVVRDFFETPVQFPSWYDPEKIRIAEDLFVSYGPITTVVLMLNAVPHFFTNPAGARSFYLAKIFSPQSVQNRMKEVPHFVINITRRGGLFQFENPSGPHGRTKGDGVMTVQKLRMAHACIRIRLRLLPKEKGWDLATLGEPINQEDMAEAVMDFCLCTLDGLAKVGLVQNREQQEATLNSWKTVGFLLGLKEELQPRDIVEARQLRDQCVARHARTTPEAIALIREMLGVSSSLLPRPLKNWPAGLMRYQLGNEFAGMLEVPNPKLLMWMFKVMKPLWGEDKFFAHLAKFISPRLVHWLIEHPRVGDHKTPVQMPEQLAESWQVRSRAAKAGST